MGQRELFQDTDSCPLMSKRLNHQTESGNTSYLLLNHMRLLRSKFHQGRWTNLRIGSGPTGTERRRSFFSSSASSWWILEVVEEEVKLLLLLLPWFHLDLLLHQAVFLLLRNLRHLDQECLHLHQECEDEEEINVDLCFIFHQNCVVLDI